MSAVDILVVTFNRPEYTRKTLDRLIESAEPSTRLWLWHNGTDEETLAITRMGAETANNAVFHHCPENVPLRVPINWLITNGSAPFAAKVDDDCLVPDGWLETIVSAMTESPELGVVAGWIYAEEDFDPDLAAHKICDLAGGRSLMRNPWVQGSGVVASRAWLERGGTLGDNESWTQYVRRLAQLGCINGWLLPLILIDHMDDPRSPNTGLHTDDDLTRTMPLSAQRNGITTLDAWLSQLRRSAHIVQTYPADDVAAHGSFPARLKWRVRGLARRHIRRRAW